MPKSNLYTPLPAKDVTNGTVTEHSPATPFPSVVYEKRSEPHMDDSPGEEHTASVDAGRLLEEVYANTLPWWREALRRKCVGVVEWESEVIATWQVRPSSRGQTRGGRNSSFVVVVFLQARVRSPWLDTYFLQTSMLGTHTFFLVFLPLFWFFGYDELGRG
jgi:hypothetical protein